MTDNLIKELNKQFNFEIESGYIYLAMNAYLKDLDMNGFAHFMFKQAHEEFEHAMDFYEFLFAIDELPEYDKIEKPKANYNSILEVFKDALEHEKLVTSKIEKLYEMALKEENYKVVEFLGKYIKEQVEEVDTFNYIVKKLERINENWGGLYIFDHELGQRK